MRVPVILVLPATGHVRASSIAAMSDENVGLNPLQAPTYPNVALDMGFAPVPVGARQGEKTPAQSLLPQNSPHFAVRGTIDVGGQPDVPHTIEDAEVYSDPEIVSLAVCQETPAVGDAATVLAKLRLAELSAMGLTGQGVALAILDMGINLPFLQTKLGRAVAFDEESSWRPTGTDNPEPGAWPVAHGTMCAYDALLGAPDATLIDAPVLSTFDSSGGSQMAGTLSAALSAVGMLLTSWITGHFAAYKALVVNNSWGIYHPSWDFPAGHPGRYCDNPQHPFNIQMGAASRAGIDVLFAAGNCGAECPGGRCQGRTKGSIMGAAAMADVLTVAGCDTTDQRVGYSSQGPSMAGMYPKKPDITAYTHFLGSEALGPGAVDGGTSAACPVASGCIAALRSSPALSPRSAMPPTRLFDLLRQTARSVGGSPSSEWNEAYGFGILDPLAAATAAKLASVA
jgi:hypothetical protein